MTISIETVLDAYREAALAYKEARAKAGAALKLREDHEREQGADEKYIEMIHHSMAVRWIHGPISYLVDYVRWHTEKSSEHNTAPPRRLTPVESDAELAARIRPMMLSPALKVKWMQQALDQGGTMLDKLALDYGLSRHGRPPI